MLVKCAFCGKEFEASQSELRRGKGRFCSMVCRAKSHSPITVLDQARADARKQRLSETKSLLDAGLVYQEIANKFGVTKQQIGLYARQLGYRRRARAQKAYEGTRHTEKNGYIRVYHDGKWLLEHRFIMEQYLGRPLDKDEIVHHINGDRSDNRIQNLQFMRRGKHIRITLRAQCHGCLIIKENKRLRARVRELERFLQPSLDKV